MRKRIFTLLIGITPLFACLPAPTTETIETETTRDALAITSFRSEWNCNDIDPQWANVVNISPGQEVLLLNAAAAGNVFIQLDKGATYTLPQTLVIGSNTIIQGTSDPADLAPIITPGAGFMDDALVTLENVEQIHIQGVTLNGPGNTMPWVTSGFRIEDSHEISLGGTTQVEVNFVGGVGYRIRSSSCLSLLNTRANELGMAATSGGCEAKDASVDGEGDGLRAENSSRIRIISSYFFTIPIAGIRLLDTSDVFLLRTGIADINPALDPDCLGKGVAIAARMAPSITTATYNLEIQSLFARDPFAPWGNPPMPPPLIPTGGAGLFMDTTAGAAANPGSQAVLIDVGDVAANESVFGTPLQKDGIRLCGDPLSFNDISSVTVVEGDIVSNVSIPSAITNSCPDVGACSFAATACATPSIWW